MGTGQEITRVSIKYRSRHPIEHEAAFGVIEFLISIHGKPYRPPKPGQDLQDVRHWLDGEGYQVIETTSHGGGRADHYRTRYTEHWSSTPAIPEPPTRPEPMTTSVEYNAARGRYEVLDQLGEMLADSHNRPEAQWAELRIYNDAIYQAALGLMNRHPELGSRALKGGAIVARGRLTLNGSPHSYDVTSRTVAGRVYRTDIPPDARDSWTCMIHTNPTPLEPARSHCPDLIFNAPLLENGSRCTHMAAAWIADRIETPSPEPEPDHKAAFEEACQQLAKVQADAEYDSHEEAFKAWAAGQKIRNNEDRALLRRQRRADQSAEEQRALIEAEEMRACR